MTGGPGATAWGQEGWGRGRWVWSLAPEGVASEPSPSPEWQGKLNSDSLSRCVPQAPQGRCPPHGLPVVTLQGTASVSRDLSRAVCGGEETEGGWVCARVCACVWAMAGVPGEHPFWPRYRNGHPREFQDHSGDSPFTGSLKSDITTFIGNCYLFSLFMSS